MEFCYNFPEDASGRFYIDFVIKYPDGATLTTESGMLLLPEISSYTKKISGTGNNPTCTVVLTNTENNKRAVIGTYNVNFDEGTIECITDEDIRQAFENVDGI